MGISLTTMKIVFDGSENRENYFSDHDQCVSTMKTIVGNSGE